MGPVMELGNGEAKSGTRNTERTASMAAGRPESRFTSHGELRSGQHLTS
jgi:hypothetical protein